MPIPNDPSWIGRRVIYRAYRNAPAEPGEIVRFNMAGDGAFVRYDGNGGTPMLTYLSCLDPESDHAA